MTHRRNRKSMILYPEDKCKNYWNLFITFILLIVCVQTPLYIAFSDYSNDMSYINFSLAVDVMFLIDMIIIFNSAFYNKDMDIIDSRK